MLHKSIFLLLLSTIISNQIDCFYYGDGDKALDLQASNLFKAELDEKTIGQPSFEQNQVQVRQDHEWNLPKNVQSRLGEIAGIAADEQENLLYIFHRGKRSWNIETDLQKISQPIKEDTVVVVNATDGSFIYSWGSDMFFMPHGISVDRFGNVWTTDVVAHQVFRFKKGYFKSPELVLGERFVPGGGRARFCMPTDTVVGSNFVYISDGYCNSRIAIYSLSGLYLEEIAYQDQMVIPHSLTLLEDEDLLCAADREGRRILCYTAGLAQQKAGKLLFSIKHPSVRRVYAIAALDDLIFGINGPDLDADEDGRTNKDKQVGFVLNLATERLLDSFYPEEGFQSPHDLTINRRTASLFISDLKSPKKIFKFSIGKN